LNPFILFLSINTYRAQYEAKRINVLPKVGQTVPLNIVGDSFRLEHVLGNLLSNAIKFSDIDSTIEVIVSVEEGVGMKSSTSCDSKLDSLTINSQNSDSVKYIRFAVKDYGVGMSHEDQELLFQPFMQIRPGELQKGRGSGLGLSICKNIITLYKGTIGCLSKQRKEGEDHHHQSGGSEFYFLIACIIPEPSSATALFNARESSFSSPVTDDEGEDGSSDRTRSSSGSEVKSDCSSQVKRNNGLFGEIDSRYLDFNEMSHSSNDNKLELLESPHREEKKTIISVKQSLHILICDGKQIVLILLDLISLFFLSKQMFFLIVKCYK
jgi:hypothetical protein